MSLTIIEKSLIATTQTFAEEQRYRSWWYVISTLLLIVMACSAAMISSPWLVQLVFSVLAGLLVLRLFILFHDFQHKAILRHSPIANFLFSVIGFLLLTPRKVWQETHNYHHAHTAKIPTSHIGSYVMVTKRMWQSMNSRQRFIYKTIRHPLNILFGMVTVFAYGMCIAPFIRNPKKHWGGLLALFLHVMLAYLLVWYVGWDVYFFGWFAPLAISGAIGAYLFYAQHNFPGVRIEPLQKWRYVTAALSSSSYMEMGPVMSWFSGNIGYHHVHHLNPRIPFYRLPEAMAAIPELQTPVRTSFRIKDIAACLSLKVWDADKKQMIPFPS